MSEPAPAALAVVPRAPEPPSWVRWKALVLDGVSSPHTRRAYDRALTAFHAWYRPDEHGPFHKAAVQAYRAALERQGLAPSSINVHLAAVRKLAQEAADNGLLDPAAAAAIAKVRGARQAGRRLGNWLTRDQAQQLLLAPDPTTLPGLRDQALLALLLGCGLRRSELAQLTLTDLQQREGRWVIVDLVGKGSRVRSVPMPAWAKAAVDRWTDAAGLGEGRLLRPVNKAGRLAGEGLTAQSIFDIVQRYSQQLGIPFAPHDLRRTFAQLAHRGRAPLEQLQRSLGHASVQTTERYLGVQQDLADAPCDRLGLRL
ncbi:MAG: tyrosine-type recombinase/integrase [Bdellovibrionales bacterium]|nr:tyrosine-type recombinase/integrase [Bdellovibrionales bacterium]